MLRLKIIFCLVASTLFSGFASAAIVRIVLDGAIDPVRAGYVVTAMRQAESQKAEFILLEMDTPGGLATSMKEIIGEILNSHIPVVAYVAPSGAHAASAGFFILESADLAVMAEGTNTGAAHALLTFVGMPVPEDGASKTLLEKVQNDSLAYLRSIVGRRGRSEDAAEAAVKESKSYTAHEALEKKLIDFIAKDEQELLQQLDGRTVRLFNGREVALHTAGVSVETVEMSLRDKLLALLADPNLAVFLGVIGILGLYFEFTHPGFVAPGVIGGICLVLAMLGFSMLPLNTVGIILILLAVGLFIAEIKVQGFGVLGIGGIISLVLGFLMLVDSPDPTFSIRPAVVWGVVLPVGVILLLLTRLVIRNLRRPVATGKEGMTGEKGTAKTDLNPHGRVFAHGEWWEAEAESGEVIPAGTEVQVTRSEGLKLFVKTVNKNVK